MYRAGFIVLLGAAVACASDETDDLDRRDTGSTPQPDATFSLPDGSFTVPEVGIGMDATSAMDAEIPFDAGTAMCGNAIDCFRELGRPPACPNGQIGLWECENSQCVLECDGMQPECLFDCDCPLNLGCAQGQCRPVDRRNTCCTNPDCPPGAFCIEPNGIPSQCANPDAGVVFDGGPGFDAGPAPVVPVGAACMDMADCNGGFCINQPGFPDGYCTAQCTPPSSCPTGATCVGFGPQQDFCLDDCATNADCRTGYQCVVVGTSTTTVCFPTPPASNNPNGDPVGSGCISDNDCRQGLSCLNQPGWPGGYCTRLFCDAVNNPCPSGASCYNFPGQSLCLADCSVSANPSMCRAGYYCFGPAGGTGGCIPR